MPLYRPVNMGASEAFAVFGGKIPRTPESTIPNQPFLRAFSNCIAWGEAALFAFAFPSLFLSFSLSRAGSLLLVWLMVREKKFVRDERGLDDAITCKIWWGVVDRGPRRGYPCGADSCDNVQKTWPAHEMGAGTQQGNERPGRRPSGY